MIYKLINSKVIISRLFDTYNIDYDAFVSRVPNWIFKAMRSIKSNKALTANIIPGTVIDYKCKMPDETYELVAVSYNGYRLPRINKINENVNDDMNKLYHPTLKYQLDNNGYIITTFETGDIKFYIKQFPTELDISTGLYFPLIPDNEELHTALEWYILRQLLYRRHLLPGMSLRDNNPFTNPAIAWEKHKAIAQNSLASLDSDDKDILSKLNRSLLVDYNYHNNSFNSNNIE